jgi:membrane dipeptidase
VVIDGLTYGYDAPSRRWDPRVLTATNLTIVDPDHDFATAVSTIATLRAKIKADPGVTVVRAINDFARAKREQKVGLIMGFQGSRPVGTDLDQVHLFHELGVRIIQLTYNDRVFAGDGCLEPVDGGLSQFGRKLIEELAVAGIVLDLSHAGRRTSLEAIAAAPKPPIVSHANPAALTPNPRNLTDEQIKAIAARDGVIGLVYWSPLCWNNEPGVRPTVAHFVDHIAYVADLVGVDHDSLASDTQFDDDTAALQQHLDDFTAACPEICGDYVQNVTGNVAASYPQGLTGPEDSRPITAELLRRGFTTAEVQQILGGNLMRVFREVWQS